MGKAMAWTPLKSGIDLFRVGGIQIRLDFSWFLIFFLVLWSLSVGYFPRFYPDQPWSTYWLAGLVATVLFFLSILAHELAHAMMAIRSGIEIPAITLFIFGGISHTAEEARSPGNEFKIAVVGPLMSFALAGLFGIAQVSLKGVGLSLAGVICGYLAWINVALGVFNLIPGFPLDGGRVFRAFWWWKTGSIQRATKVASDIGKGFAYTLMVLGALEIFAGVLIGGLWLIFIGMFLRGVAQASYQQLMVRHALEGIRAEDVMIGDPVTISPALTLRQAVDEYFLRYGYRGFPVTEEDGSPLGLLSLDQVKGMPERDRNSRTVREAMVPLDDALKIAPTAPLSEGLKKLGEGGAGRLLVMEDGKMRGMVTERGLLRHLEMKQIFRE